MITRLRRRLTRRGPGRADSGRAIVEFVLLGLLLIVPLFYLVATLGRVQAAAFAVSTASREAGRAYTTAPAGTDPSVRARAAGDLSFADYGFDQHSLSIVCDGTPCLRADGRITVTATVTVPLPFLPDAVADVIPVHYPVSATHVATVARFRAGVPS